MIVDAVQFVRPHGHKRYGQVEISDSLSDKVELAEKHNLMLEMEVLQTGEISAALSHKEGDVVCSIFKNTPENKTKLDGLYAKLTEECIFDFLKEIDKENVK